MTPKKESHFNMPRAIPASTGIPVVEPSGHKCCRAGHTGQLYIVRQAVTPVHTGGPPPRHGQHGLLHQDRQGGGGSFNTLRCDSNINLLGEFCFLYSISYSFKYSFVEDVFHMLFID